MDGPQARPYSLHCSGYQVKAELIFPIATATGNFSNSRLKTTKNGILISTRPRRTPTKHTLSVRPKTLPCLAHKFADALYQNFSPETKARWRAAAKAPVKSPYDLWMQECLTNFNSGRNAPKTPSISGGFTTYKTNSDSSIPPPTNDFNIEILNAIVKSGKDPF